MPKKVNRRPAKGRARSRPAAPRSNTATPVLEQNGAVETVGADAPTSVTAAVTARPPSSRPTAAQRAVPAARKAPTLTINYAYLRRDLTTLVVLACTMIVLVVVAYFLFH